MAAANSSRHWLTGRSGVGDGRHRRSTRRDELLPGVELGGQTLHLLGADARRGRTSAAGPAGRRPQAQQGRAVHGARTSSAREAWDWNQGSDLEGVPMTTAVIVGGLLLVALGLVASRLFRLKDWPEPTAARRARSGRAPEPPNPDPPLPPLVREPCRQSASRCLQGSLTNAGRGGATSEAGRRARRSC